MKTTAFIVSVAISLPSAALARNTTASTEAPAAPAAGLAQDKKFDITVLRLSPRVAVFYGDPWTNAVVAIASQKGMVVVDAPFSKTIARGFRDAIQKEFKRDDFAFLINSHDHMCHVGGNEAYADVPIVGHESVRRSMLERAKNPKWPEEWSGMVKQDLDGMQKRRAKADARQIEEMGFADYEKCWNLVLADYRSAPAVVPPTITFDREKTLDLGDLTVRLTYYCPAHSSGDSLISVPEENLILTGGLFYAPHLPILGGAAEHATPRIVDNGFAIIHAVLNGANDQTRFIPSHDRNLMKKAQVGQQLAYLEKLWTGLRRAKSEGRTLEQARTALSLQNFPEVASLSNECNRGTPWELLDIHNQNIGCLWKVAEK